MSRIARLVPLFLVIAPGVASAADQHVAPLASSAGSVLQVVFGLLVVVALIVGLSWLTKRMGIVRNFANGPLKVVGSVSLGGRERAVLIEVNDTWVVAGVAVGQVNVLATLPKGELGVTPQVAGGNFALKFKSMIEKSGHAK